jgi:hypothetical protein
MVRRQPAVGVVRAGGDRDRDPAGVEAGRATAVRKSPIGRPRVLDAVAAGRIAAIGDRG